MPHHLPGSFAISQVPKPLSKFRGPYLTSRIFRKYFSCWVSHGDFFKYEFISSSKVMPYSALWRKQLRETLSQTLKSRCLRTALSTCRKGALDANPDVPEPFKGLKRTTGDKLESLIAIRGCRGGEHTKKKRHPLHFSVNRLKAGAPYLYNRGNV